MLIGPPALATVNGLPINPADPNEVMKLLLGDVEYLYTECAKIPNAPRCVEAYIRAMLDAGGHITMAEVQALFDAQYVNNKYWIE